MSKERLAAVHDRIRAAALRAGRQPEEIKLLGAAKLQSSAAVAQLFRAGCLHFGENYVQEAQKKQEQLKDLLKGGHGRPWWHLIGPLQSNKAGKAVELFDWVHTVDRLRLARRVSDRALQQGRRPKVLVQLNTSGEPSKSGIGPEEAMQFCTQIASLAGLDLRGLMCIPRLQPDPAASRPEFRLLAELLREIRSKLGREEMVELSMGMSADLEVAIEEGATIVRVGTALFGPRPK